MSGRVLSRSLGVSHNKVIEPLERLQVVLRREHRVKKLQFAQLIPKKGDVLQPNSYRPNYLISVISMAMETVSNKQLLFHLQHNGLMSNHQFGEGSERSTANLLFLVTNKFDNSFEGHGKTNVIAANISKAFNHLWHLGLVGKLFS